MGLGSGFGQVLRHQGEQRVGRGAARAPVLCDAGAEQPGQQRRGMCRRRERRVPGVPQYAVRVRYARGWYAYSVCTVVPPRGKLPCASGTYSSQGAGTRSPPCVQCGGSGRHVSTQASALGAPPPRRALPRARPRSSDPAADDAAPGTRARRYLLCTTGYALAMHWLLNWLCTGHALPMHRLGTCCDPDCVLATTRLARARDER